MLELPFLELRTLGPLFHMRKFHDWNFQTWYVRLECQDRSRHGHIDNPQRN
jgi:hypothetical protein